MTEEMNDSTLNDREIWPNPVWYGLWKLC